MLRFLVRGSSGREYEIVASRVGNDFRMTCACEAGQKGTYCKHRFGLLDGDITDLLSDNSHQVKELAAMFAGTEVARRYAIVQELKQQKEAVEERLRTEQKALGREMNR